MRTHALVLLGLANLADPDASVALLEFAAAHGRKPLRRGGALERRELATYLAMRADCERGDWISGRERTDAAFPAQDGAPTAHALTSLYCSATCCGARSAARPRWSSTPGPPSAALRRTLPGDPFSYLSVRERTLGCVRLGSVLFEMGDGACGIEAMRIVNLQRGTLTAYPRSRVLDQAARESVTAEAALLEDINGRYNNPEAPELPELAPGPRRPHGVQRRAAAVDVDCDNAQSADQTSRSSKSTIARGSRPKRTTRRSAHGNALGAIFVGGAKLEPGLRRR